MVRARALTERDRVRGRRNKDDGLREKARKRTALPSPTPQNPAVVDLAEHFNDSSLPHAFTVPAASRLGYRSIRVRFEVDLEQVSIAMLLTFVLERTSSPGGHLRPVPFSSSLPFDLLSYPPCILRFPF